MIKKLTNKVKDLRASLKESAIVLIDDVIYLDVDLEARNAEVIKNTIYIEGIDVNLKWNEIQEVFEQVGRIARVDLPKEKKKNKGFAFVEYCSEASVGLAKEKWDNCVVDRLRGQGKGVPLRILTKEQWLQCSRL